MSKIIIPENYTPALNLYDTQRAIGTVKRLFADTLCATLNLYRVSAPLFVEASTGLNDDLNGVERKVTFDTKDSGIEVQVVQSLAKWKRKALKDYGFRVGSDWTTCTSMPLSLVSKVTFRSTPFKSSFRPVEASTKSGADTR